MSLGKIRWVFYDVNEGGVMIEYCRLNIEYLWNAARRQPRGRTINLKKREPA